MSYLKTVLAYVIQLFLLVSCNNDAIELKIKSIASNLESRYAEKSMQEIPELWVFVSIENHTDRFLTMEIPRVYSEDPNGCEVYLYFKNDSIRLYSRHDPLIIELEAKKARDIILITKYKELAVKKELYGHDSDHKFLKYLRDNAYMVKHSYCL